MDATKHDVIRVEIPERGEFAIRVKRTFQALIALAVLRRRVCLSVTSLLLGRRRAFLQASESIASLPGWLGVYMRQAFYRKTLARCGEDVHFGWSSVWSVPEAEVGDRAYVGRFCSVGYAIIGPEAMLADGVQVLSGGREHNLDSVGDETMRMSTQTYQRVRIGAGAWVGAGAVVMADVGQGAVVGAGAVVNNPIPDFAVAVGVPARVIRLRAPRDSRTATVGFPSSVG